MSIILNPEDVLDIEANFKFIILHLAYLIKVHKKYTELTEFQIHLTRHIFWKIENCKINEKGIDCVLTLYEQKTKVRKKTLTLYDLMREYNEKKIGYFHIQFAELITFAYRYCELAFQINIDETKLKKFNDKLLVRMRELFNLLNLKFPFLFLPEEYNPNVYLSFIPPPEGFKIEIPPPPEEKIKDSPLKILPPEST